MGYPMNLGICLDFIFIKDGKLPTEFAISENGDVIFILKPFLYYYDSMTRTFHYSDEDNLKNVFCLENDFYIWVKNEDVFNMFKLQKKE